MYEQDNIAIQNLQGQLICRQVQGNAAAIAALFEENGVYDAPDDGIVCHGRNEVERYFEAAFSSEQIPLTMSHTPAICVNEDGMTARATWYASTFDLLRQETGCAMVQGSARYDADLVKTTDGWKYAALQFYYLMTLEPAAYGADAVPLVQRAAATPMQSEQPSPEDFLAISNRIGRWCQDRREGAETWFVQDGSAMLDYPSLLERPAVGGDVFTALAELKRREQAILPYPMTVAMIASPWITVSSDGCSACGHWILLSHNAQSDDNGAAIHPRLSQLMVEFVREDMWKIRTWQEHPLLDLPENRLLDKESNDTLFALPEHWLGAPLPANNHSMQAISDALKLEEYVTFWVSGLRYRSEAPFYYQRLDLGEPEQLYYRVGLRPAAEGLKEVTERIFAMTNKFATCQPKAPGNHIGTTPVIEVLPGEQTAQATWLDYGWTTAAEVFGITKPPYFANPAIGRYEMRFRKVNGTWKLHYFRWTPFFRMEKWHFNYETTKGWSGTTSRRRFPLPLEYYIYENDEALRGTPVVLEAPAIDCPYEKPWTGELDHL